MDAAVPEPTTWRIGETVLVRGRRWRIVGLTRGTDCVAVGLAHAGEADVRARTLLLPFDRPRRLDFRGRPRVLRSRRWLDELRRRVFAMRPFGGLQVTARSAVRLMAYQLEPALAALRHGATRMLIADAVGMGKTIQAGLVLAELASRSELFRGLVLVPAGLKDQWARELQRHFDLMAAVIDATHLRSTASMRPPDVNPWSLPGLYIASSDFVKRPEVLYALEEVTWDVVVVDEAHSATSGSDRRAAAHAIAMRSSRVVLLTATPHADDPHESDALHRIGNLPGGDGPLLVFRRSRGDAGPYEPRRSRVLLVTPSAAERRMHALLGRYTQRVWAESARRDDDLAKLAVVVLRKRALSSAASLALSVARRLELLAGAGRADVEQLRLPLGDEDPLEDDEPLAALAAPGLSDLRRERRWLTSIAEAARHASRAETKLAFLLRLLARVREPVIVFTEYRDTLVRLARAVAASGRGTIVLHGGMAPADRSRVQQEFNSGHVSLIATDAAAEGLNLQSRCRIVVHYELPWRGSRLEQRAGRVDRLGQPRRVHEIALVARDTAESLVLGPLVSRAARAHRLGHDPSCLIDALTESRVADLVMGCAGTQVQGDETRHRAGGIGAEDGTSSAVTSGHPATARSSSFVTMDLRTEAEAEVARLELQRQCSQMMGIGSISVPPGPIVSALRRYRSSLPDGLVLVYRLALTLPDGLTVHDEPLVVHLPLRPTARRPMRTRALREVVALFARGTRTSASSGPLVQHSSEGEVLGLDAAIQSVLRTVAPLHSEAARRLALRHTATRAVHTSTAAQLVQVGLFDSRAVRELTRRERVRVALEDEPSAGQPGVDAELAPAAELVAAIVITPGRRGR